MSGYKHQGVSLAAVKLWGSLGLNGHAWAGDRGRWEHQIAGMQSDKFPVTLSAGESGRCCSWLNCSC